MAGIKGMPFKVEDYLAHFLARTKRVGDCLIWQGAVGNSGYPKADVDGRTVGVHRYVCEQVHGLPRRHEPDHLCRIKICIRPEHLEPVTRAENLRRSALGPGGRWTRFAAPHKTHCKRGHLLSGKNLGRARYRRCLACHRMLEAERRLAS